MAANASRFVYEIQAAYTGQDSIQQLQRDLDALGRARGYQEAVDNFAELTEQVAAAEAQVTALNAALAAAPGDNAAVEALEAAVRQHENLQEQMEQSFSALDQAADALGEYGLSLDGVGDQLTALEQHVQQAGQAIAAQNLLGLPDPADVQNRIQALRQAYQTLQNTPGITQQQLAQAHLNMLQQIQQLQQSTQNWAGALAQARIQILALAAAFAAVGKGIQMAIEFESNMAEVRKTVGGTKEEIAALGVELRNLSMYTGFSPGELAEIAAIGGQLGVAREEIADFVKTASTMGTAFDMAAGEAGDAIAKLGNVFQIPLDEVARLGDAINQLGNNTAARERDIVNVMLRIGGASRQFGLAEKNAAALAATMLSLGRAPEVAGTAINAMLTKLQAAGAQPKRFQEALSRLGIQAQTLAQQIQDNPQKALDELLETLSRLQGAEQTEILTGLFGAEFGDDVGILVGSLDTYRKALHQVGDEAKYAGAMAEEARNKNDTTAHALELLGETLRNIWTTVGEGFRPAVEAAAEAATALLRPVAEFLAESPKMAAWTVSILGFTAAVRPLIFLFSTLRVAALAFWSSMAGATSATVGLRAALTRLGGVTSIATLAWQVGSFLESLDTVKIGAQQFFAWWDARIIQAKLGWAKLFGSADEVAALQRELDQVKELYWSAERDVKAASKSAADAQKKGQKEVTDSAKQNNAEQVEDNKQAAKEMTEAYKRHVEEVKRLQEEITGRQKSLQAELRDMARGGMNDADAWVDQRNAAKEYIKLAKQAADEARRAQAGGDSATAAAKWKEAVQYADDAKAAYKALNHEVKIGDQVVISSQTALKGAMRGVKEAGELGISFLKEQEKAATDAAAALEKGNGIDKLTEGMSEAEKKWVEGWRKMRGAVEDTAEQVYKVWQNAAGFWTNTEDAFSAGWSKGVDEFTANWNDGWAKFERQAKDAAQTAKRAIDEATKDRTTTIRIRTLETKRWGGMVGEALKFSRGGRLPGFGGGDKVSALLERGEFVIRKEAVRRFGAGFFHALNALKLPPLPDLTGLFPATAAAGGAGGSAPGMVLELKLPGGDTVAATVSGPDAERLIRFNRRVSNLRFRK